MVHAWDLGNVHAPCDTSEMFAYTLAWEYMCNLIDNKHSDNRGHVVVKHPHLLSTQFLICVYEVLDEQR